MCGIICGAGSAPNPEPNPQPDNCPYCGSDDLGMGIGVNSVYMWCNSCNKDVWSHNDPHLHE